MSRKICIYDSTPGSIFKAEFWYTAGAKVFAWAFDKVLPARNAAEFYKLLEQCRPGDEVQLWGHGGPGAPYVAGERIYADHPAWRNIAGGVAWFRSCSVAQGPEGYKFVNALMRHGVGFAGHLAVIGVQHSYLVGVRDGQQPWWSQSLKPKGSGLFEPNTVWPTTMSIPNWAFKKNPKLS